MKQETSQQDYIIRPARRDDEMHIPNEERIWTTWNHYSISARVQEEGRTNNSKKGMKKKWTGWKLKTEDETVEFKKRWKRTKVRKTILILFEGTWRLLPARWFATRKRKEEKLHYEYTRECQTT